MNFANVGIAVTIVEVQQAALDRGLASDPQEPRELGRRRAASRRKKSASAWACSTATLNLRGRSPTVTSSSRPSSRTWRSRRKSSLTSTPSQSPAASSPPTPSYLDVNEIASVTKRPQDVIGHALLLARPT